MALSANEFWAGGFVRDNSVDPPALAMTTSLVGARMDKGFLRDPDGRLVVVVIQMANKTIQGFTRDEATGALLVTGVGGGSVDTSSFALKTDPRFTDARYVILQERWKPTGVKYENFRRDDCINVSGIASGLMQCTGPFVIQPNDPITTIGMYSGATAAVTPTNQWFAIQDAANDQVVAVTNDDTTTAWTANQLKTLTIAGGPWTPTVETMVRVCVCVVAATPPSFFGKTGTSTAAAAFSAPPKIVGRDGTARTGPVAIGTTLTFSTLEFRMPYFQLS